MSQSIITEVNHAIGASGVVGQECKAVVAQYGDQIISMLLDKVSLSSNTLSRKLCCPQHFIMLVMILFQEQPQKICSQIGLCTFDGARGVGYITLLISSVHTAKNIHCILIASLNVTLLHYLQ